MGLGFRDRGILSKESRSVNPRPSLHSLSLEKADLGIPFQLYFGDDVHCRDRGLDCKGSGFSGFGCRVGCSSKPGCNPQDSALLVPSLRNYAQSSRAAPDLGILEVIPCCPKPQPQALHLRPASKHFTRPFNSKSSMCQRSTRRAGRRRARPW